MESPRIDALLSAFEKRPPASEELIRQAEATLGVVLPTDYRTFLSSSNGGEGPVGEHGYLHLYPIEEIVQIRADYTFDEACPRLVPIGTNLGGTAYCFGTNGLSGFYGCEFMDASEEDARHAGSTFLEMLDYIGSGVQ